MRFIVVTTGSILIPCRSPSLDELVGWQPNLRCVFAGTPEALNVVGGGQTGLERVVSA